MVKAITAKCMTDLVENYLHDLYYIRSSGAATKRDFILSSLRAVVK